MITTKKGKIKRNWGHVFDLFTLGKKGVQDI
jgi:hypothetical protein